MPNLDLLNAWHVAARSDELTDRPLARCLLEVPVVMYRCADGSAAALADRCPHLEAPLSTGSIIGDLIVCAYHGLRVRQDGVCVDQRLSDEARAASRVRTFPLVERDSLLWIWMGDPAQADTALIGARAAG